MTTPTTAARVSGTLDPIVGKCRRTVVWHGETQEIEVEKHSFEWSGRIPCTGMRRCIYCGQYEHDLANSLLPDKEGE